MQKTLTDCPFCGFELPTGAESCPRCDLPLAEPVVDPGAGEHPPPLPEYCQGRLRVVTTAANQAEAELLAGMLRNERVPCMIRRAPSADVPDFLAAGRRDLLVPESGQGLARELLGVARTDEPPPRQQAIGDFLVVFVSVVLAFVIAAGAIYMLIT